MSWEHDSCLNCFLTDYTPTLLPLIVTLYLRRSSAQARYHLFATRTHLESICLHFHADFPCAWDDLIPKIVSVGEGVHEQLLQGLSLHDVDPHAGNVGLLGCPVCLCLCVCVQVCVCLGVCVCVRAHVVCVKSRVSDT